MVQTPTATGAAQAQGRAPQAALSVAEARSRILETVRALTDTERVSIDACAGRVLAEPVVAGVPMPPFDSAAMDGYAIRHEPLSSGPLPVCGRSLPGRPYAGTLPAGACARITTGAALPAGTDTVVPQEAVTRTGDRVAIERMPERGAWVRPAGSDIAAGSRLLSPGARLRAVDCGLLASQGRRDITVHRRPRVAYFTTGDELQSPGQTLGPGQIHERHAPTLAPMVRRLGGVFENRGIIADDPAAIRAELSDAAAGADMVLTSGGVGAGDTDYLRQAAAGLGRVQAWRIALRPGRLILSARLDGVHYFALPGNPVSALVLFVLIVAPALLRMAGARECEPFICRARSAEAIDKAPGHTRVMSGVASRTDDDDWQVHSAGPQGPAAFSSLAAANCLVVLPHGSAEVSAGDSVDILPFELLQ